MSRRTNTRAGGRAGRALALASCLLAVGLSEPVLGGVVFNNAGLVGGSRWDAAPRTVGRNERSMDGGLRYSVEGGSYQAYRDMFNWTVVPSVGEFQQAIEQAFAAWSAPDPATGLGTYLAFVPDFATPVIGSTQWATVNTNGAEIDLLAHPSGDSGTRAWTTFGGSGAFATLTTGEPNYNLGYAISGADIQINDDPGAVYTLGFFRRLLTHEIGHALGLGDIENADNAAAFIDDNYDGSSSGTALTTLTNSWAELVDPIDPANSPLSLYQVNNASPGIDSPGVDLLMESGGLGIGPNNPQSNLFPLTNDEYGTRQFLYPWLDPGDTDGDRDIDNTDLGKSIGSFTGPVGAAGGRALRDGDSNRDGDVDNTDLGVAIGSFTGPTGTPAPEPGSLALLTIGGLLMARWRR